MPALVTPMPPVTSSGCVPAARTLRARVRHQIPLGQAAKAVDGRLQEYGGETCSK